MTAALTAELPRDTSAGLLARHQLEDFGPDVSTGQMDALKLTVTELVNNAVVHGTGAIRLSVELRGGVLHGEVSDAGAGIPPPRPGRRGSHRGGWGLQIVDETVDAWGTRPGRSVVWFELALA